MPIKIKKIKKSKRMRGTTTHGWGARKKHKGSGHRGGKGMSGTGKRADHKKSFVIKKYGNKYFGKQGITSKSTAKKKTNALNIRDILMRFPNQKEIILKDYKILGDGEITNSVTIKAESFTKIAKEKIEKSGGQAIELKKEYRRHRVKASTTTLEKDNKIKKSESEKGAEPLA